MARGDDARGVARRSSGMWHIAKNAIVCCGILATLLALGACATTGSAGNQPTTTIAPTSTATPAPAFTQLDSECQLLLSDPSTLTHQQVLDRNSFIDDFQQFDIPQIVGILAPRGGIYPVGLHLVRHPAIGEIDAYSEDAGGNEPLVMHVDCGVITTNTGKILVLASPQSASSLHGKWEATLETPWRLANTATLSDSGVSAQHDLLGTFPSHLHHVVLFMYPPALGENQAYLTWVANHANVRPSYVVSGSALQDANVTNSIGSTASSNFVFYFL